MRKTAEGCSRFEGGGVERRGLGDPVAMRNAGSDQSNISTPFLLACLPPSSPNGTLCPPELLRCPTAWRRREGSPRRLSCRCRCLRRVQLLSRGRRSDPPIDRLSTRKMTNTAPGSTLFSLLGSWSVNLYRPNDEVDDQKWSEQPAGRGPRLPLACLRGKVGPARLRTKGSGWASTNHAAGTRGRPRRSNFAASVDTIRER